MGPIITFPPVYMGSYFCVSMFVWVWDRETIRMGVQSVKYQPLGRSFGPGLWDLYGALYHFHAGVYFRKVHCVSAILALHFHEQQDFGGAFR